MDKQLRDITVGEWKAICDQRTQARNSGDSDYACPGCPMNSVCAATPDEWALPEDTPTDEAKPRLAEVLGVDVEERFKIPGYDEAFYVDIFGVVISCEGGYLQSEDLAECINHPESIIRAPRLTDGEIEICRVHHAKYVTKSKNNRGPWVYLWNGKPTEDSGDFFGSEETGVEIVAWVNEKSFPSVKPGDCVCVEEVGGNED